MARDSGPTNCSCFFISSSASFTVIFPSSRDGRLNCHQSWIGVTCASATARASRGPSAPVPANGLSSDPDIEIPSSVAHAALPCTLLYTPGFRRDSGMNSTSARSRVSSLDHTPTGRDAPRTTRERFHHSKPIKQALHPITTPAVEGGSARGKTSRRSGTDGQHRLPLSWRTAPHHTVDPATPDVDSFRPTWPCWACSIDLPRCPTRLQPPARITPAPASRDHPSFSLLRETQENSRIAFRTKGSGLAALFLAADVAPIGVTHAHDDQSLKKRLTMSIGARFLLDVLFLRMTQGDADDARAGVAARCTSIVLSATSETRKMA